ncbi:Dienelactone hydrolase [Daejeonella rubra]|uniref:Dienelactone hydrolase n=1 Tax=Daejeonella rubra TaxID=990371 RepID=A0A1G9VB54_9SPHI|nr:acetylxylan esterase [Daejeonella rubra]SDM69389.1 Dienelactone hydrolase [Daejeonella rubra]
MKNNRRDFIRLAGMAGLGFTGVNILPANAEIAGSEINTLPDEVIQPFNRFPRMMQDHFEKRVGSFEENSARKRASLKTKQDAEKYILDVRSKIAQCFGPWPEKTSLNARITGIIERDTYRIEKIVFDSRPGFPVTANLYVPKGRKFPLPGVIGTCGHGDPGKATPIYQSFAQGLARQGYVVLIFDPIGQGERVQYLTKDLKPIHGIGVSEHNYSGKQMVLNGESLSSWFTWDCIRCVDYLLSRPEVDSKHIGVTGNSGGGTQATWLCGAEPRLTMAAPSCFVVGFEQNLKNELPADIEQCPPGAISLGLDHLDFIAAMAPKPVILLSQEKDFFDVRGAQKSYNKLKKLYKLLGAEDNIQFFAGPEYHGFSKHNREAMYSWFNKVTGISDAKSEPDLKLEEIELLWCTSHGQVGESGPRTLASFTKEISQSLNARRGTPRGDGLKKLIQTALKLPSRIGTPEYRILRTDSGRHYPKKYAATYVVETEEGITLPVYRLSDTELISRPPAGIKRAVLYVSHLSADNELRQESFLRELILSEPASAVYACDVRGIGESKPNTCGDDFFGSYGNDYFYAAHGIMLNSPYTGQKTFDLLRIIDWLISCGHEEIHLAAKGWGTIPATFAAVISENVKQVTFKNALSSYSEIAENEEFNWPLSTLLPGVLKHFDLPDCYRELGRKKLIQIESMGAVGVS